MKKTILILAAAALMAGCMNRRAAVQETDREYIVPEDVTSMSEDDIIRESGGNHVAQNSLDYAGTYKGVIPCADCSGIETALTLREDGTYKLTSKYREKNDNVYTSEGTYRWDSDGTRIILDGGDAHGNRYFVGEGRIWMLDRDGERIEGPNAEHYILTKE